MIYIIAAIFFAICGWVIIFQDQQIRKLKAEKSGRDFSISDGEILGVIQKSEDISYYRDYYKDDGKDMALHTIGAKEWSFQDCKEYGLVVMTLREHQFDVGRDMLEYMLPVYAKRLETFMDTAKVMQEKKEDE